MKAENNEVKETDKHENIDEQAACGPGCDCEADGSKGRTRWIVGIVILLIAGGLVARAVINDGDGADTQETGATFAAVIPATNESKPLEILPSTSEKADVGIAGQELSTLADLNQLAVNSDAVFVYLPGKDVDGTKNAPVSQLEAAVNAIKAQGITVGVYTLKTDAPEYAQLAAQMAVPGVLTMAKGRGMVPVKGEVTENSLIQSFVAASSAGGCGPSGCGPSGCN